MTELRAARPEDAPACAGLLQDWLDATPWMPKLHSLAETEAWMRDRLFPAAEVWVLDAGRDRAGALGARAEGATEGGVGAQVAGAIQGFLALQDGRDIAQLIVAPGARGTGAGQRLLAAVKARATEGLGLWCFVANLPARRFYAREGFVERGGTAGENAEGLPDLWLEWGRP